MRKDGLYFVAAAAILSAGWLLTPLHSQVRDRHMNLSIRGDAETCADLDVRSDGAMARAEQNLTVPSGSPLQIDGGSRGAIRVRGWDRPDYAIQACRIAVAEDRAAADRLLAGIQVSQSGSRLSVSGADAGEWMVYFLVRAPRKADLDLETRNHPVSVADISGNLKVRTTNGPLAIHDCNGEVQARAQNGPISFSGSGGNASVVTQNGPVSVKLAGNTWNGQGLEVRTMNGPLSVSLPDDYHSGVRIESSGHAPFSCRAGICANGYTADGSGQRSVQFNGSNTVVRFSTGNGPVSINSPSRGPRMI
jgi:hypothetical protein